MEVAETDRIVLDIKKDLEFVQTQLHYLDKYLSKVEAAEKRYSGGGRWWTGPALKHELYDEIERWLKSYNRLEDHMKKKLIADSEITSAIAGIPSLSFVRPLHVSEEDVKGFKKFSYLIFPFYRAWLNKRKIKMLTKQVRQYQFAFALIKKAAFRIEAYYLDGV